MPKRWMMIVLSVSLCAVSGSSWAQQSLNASGAYLGQQPPGSTPQPFAPGLVTTQGYEYGGVFSPRLDAFYFIRGTGEGYSQDFVVLEDTGDNWQERVISQRVGQPSLAPDGQTMHLGARYMERTDQGWSEILELDPQFQNFEIMRMTSSSQGTYVFDEIGLPDGDGVIRYARQENGTYQPPQAFGPNINTGSYNAHPFIAPDESYLLWDGRRDSGFGNSDIYVSFRQDDGSWGEAINLGESINTSAWEAAASVTPDGKYLFFHRMIDEGAEDALPNVDIFWVDAQIIYDLKSD